jgi:hypothetical protein
VNKEGVNPSTATCLPSVIRLRLQRNSSLTHLVSRDNPPVSFGAANAAAERVIDLQADSGANQLQTALAG